MYQLKRQPSHPGVILKEEFLLPLNLSPEELAKELKTTSRLINEILHGKREVSPDMALRLARFFGTSEELWLSLQDQYNLYKAKQKNKTMLRKIKPYKEAVNA